MSDARAAYNARQSGTLWSAKDLPAPLNTLDPASTAFADAVAAAQKAKGLVADGMLGPTSLAAIAPKAPGPVPALVRCVCLVVRHDQQGADQASIVVQRLCRLAVPDGQGKEAPLCHAG